MRGELETELNCNILIPQLFRLQQISFPFSWAAQPGTRGSSLCWDMVLIPATFLQLIWTSCRRGYIIIWRPPTSCERHNSHSIQPFDSQGCPLISTTGCTCYLHRCISFDSLAGVNMLHLIGWNNIIKEPSLRHYLPIAEVSWRSEFDNQTSVEKKKFFCLCFI